MVERQPQHTTAVLSTMVTSIFITGANQGLGYETALQVSKHSDILLIIGGRSEEKIKQAATNISAAEGCKAQIEYVVIDISQDQSIFDAVKAVESKLGGKGLDVLMNNAAISIDGKEPALTEIRDALRKTYETNVFGTIVVTEAFLPLVKKGTESRIINIGSDLGSLTLQTSEAAFYYRYGYCTSKTAINAATVVTAMTNKDVHLTVLNPGFTATALNNYSGHNTPEEAVKVFVEHALKRTGKSPGYYGNEGEIPW